MKTLNQFYSETEKKNINESIILEDLSFKSDPPNIIMLKRKAIRIFPDGRKVALYYADKIKKYVSIPYFDMVHNDKNLMQVHEKWTPRGNMGVLMQILDSGQPGTITFENNLSVKIDVMTAQSMLIYIIVLIVQTNIKLKEWLTKTKIILQKLPPSLMAQAQDYKKWQIQLKN